jgi:hypothetical protein
MLYIIMYKHDLKGVGITNMRYPFLIQLLIFFHYKKKGKTVYDLH